MTLRGFLGVATLIVATGSLGGCVAAVIPVAAAGMLAKGQLEGRDQPRGSYAPTQAVVPRPTTPAPVDASVTASQSGSHVVMTGMTELPRPSAAPDAQRNEAIQRFSDYALEQAMRDPARLPREGALLTEAGSLRPIRQECAAQPPAILIDLDPGRGTFDPLGDLQIEPSLAPALLSLREQGVAVLWQSRLGENFGEALREVLIEDGLDPRGEDRLLLASSLDERKQTLRDDLAKNYCIVAILGDERADFDELYLYLKDPGVAFPLEPLIGQGWFLADPIVQGDE